MNVQKKFMVEVVYIAATGVCYQQQFEVTSGTTVAEVLEQSGIIIQYPEIANYSYAVFAVKVAPDYLVAAGDRIEICRPLKLDPMAKRRARA